MKYRKKPVEIEAIQWNGENVQEIIDFAGDACEFLCIGNKTVVNPKDALMLTIHSLEGPMHASPNDFIIKGVKGEFYPCKPDVFEQTYEVVE